MAKQLISLTSTARSQLLTMLRGHNSNAALFSVQGGGCNGLRYDLQPTNDAKQPLDEDQPIQDGYALRICGKSMLHIVGTEIDWVDDFMGQGFGSAIRTLLVHVGAGARLVPMQASSSCARPSKPHTRRCWLRRSSCHRSSCSSR